jgi:UDP-N-acetyl-D-mannosaminuronic acid dehydrogenase
VESLNKGQVLIVEPDLDILVKSAVNSGQLKASLSPEAADIFIIAVPTPFCDGKKPDLSFIDKAVEGMAGVIKSGDLIILESTSPVGTTERIAEQLRRLRPEMNVPVYDINSEPSSDADIYLAHCPERVLPGRILRELVENDRIVGGINTASSKKAADFYNSFVNSSVHETDSRTAELSKLVENSFRDVNIAFANELSMICDDINVNVSKVVELANRHPRVNILSPGPGVGGHCIAVDPWFIVDASPERSRLIRTARGVNDHKTDYVLEKIKEAAKERGAKKIACFGITYKADIDDVRESPSLRIVDNLASDSDLQIIVVEPNLETLPGLLKRRENVSHTDVDEALKSSDLAVLLVSHQEFKGLFDAKEIRNKTLVYC